jgi:hypothetical protein
MVGAFLGRMGLQERSDAFPRGFDGSLRGLVQRCFELGEDLLDRIEVGPWDAGLPSSLHLESEPC